MYYRMLNYSLSINIVFPEKKKKKSIISILTNMFPTEYIMLLLLAHTFEISECQIFSYNLSILGEEWAQLLQILGWGQDSTCRAHDSIQKRFNLKNTTSYMNLKNRQDHQWFRAYDTWRSLRRWVFQLVIYMRWSE